jgi:dihydrofolate synthase/folylpolyglutamate synthase
VPCATGRQPPEAAAVIAARAAELGAPLHRRDGDWWVEARAGGIAYRDSGGALDLPPPGLAGPHQMENAGIAIAALRGWGPDWLTPAAIAGGVAAAEWPARMQRLQGGLARQLPPGWELWLDGGHNAGGGLAIAETIAGWGDRPLHLVVGMKQGKASGDFLQPLLPFGDSLWAVAEPGQHLAMPVEAIIAASGGRARPGPHVADALRAIAEAGGPPARVLICGSLYLAGEVLKADG